MALTDDQLNAAIKASPQLDALRQAMLAQFWQAPKAGAGFKDGGAAYRAYVAALQQIGYDPHGKFQVNPNNHGYVGDTSVPWGTLALGAAAGAGLGLIGPVAAALHGAAPTATGVGLGETGATTGLGSTAALGPSAIAPEVLGPSALAGTGITAADIANGSGGAIPPPAVPPVTKNAGSSALGWLGLIGQIATPVIGGYLGAKATTDATNTAVQGQLDAAKIQAASTKDALDFAKQGYITQQQQLAPYVGTGGAAITKLSQLTGLGTPKPYVVPASLQNLGSTAPATSTAGLGTATTPTTTQAPTAPTGRMVTLRAPNGDIAQKPESEAQHWISLGATLEQQGTPSAGVLS